MRKSTLQLKIETRTLSTFGAFWDSYKLRNSHQTIIITNNCWGGYYKDLDIPFITPFIGLFLEPDHYVNLIKNFDMIINSKLVVEKGEGYPIGYLGDVKLDFLHYENSVDAYDKFSRRRDRLLEIRMKKPTSRVIVKFCDTNGATSDQINDFYIYCSRVGTPITFTKDKIDQNNNFKIKRRHIINNRLPDGLRLYKLRYSYLNFANFISEY